LTPADRRLAQINAMPRQAFLLVSLESFSEEQAAAILNVDRQTFKELVEESGRIWLGLLVPGPRIQALGAVRGMAQDTCEVGAGYLACMTTAAQLRIWRYRR